MALNTVGSLGFLVGVEGVSCPITLSGELNGIVELRNGQELGTFTEVSIDTFDCSGGAVSTILGMPYRLRVSGTIGTLPSELLGILVAVENFAILFSVFRSGINCLYEGSLGLDVLLTRHEAGYLIEGVTTNGEAALLSRQSGGLGCPPTVVVAGTFTLIPAQTLFVT